jgi:hypothetical protein
MIALPSFTDCSQSPCDLVRTAGAWAVAYATTIVEDIES